MKAKVNKPQRTCKQCPNSGECPVLKLLGRKESINFCAFTKLPIDRSETLGIIIPEPSSEWGETLNRFVVEHAN